MRLAAKKWYNMNRQKAARFAKYFTILFLSLLFVELIIIVAINVNTIITAIMTMGLMIVSSIIAARDAGYIHIF